MGSRYLGSQVAQKKRPLHPKVAHTSLKVAPNFGPLAFQVAVGLTNSAPKMGDVSVKGLVL